MSRFRGLLTGSAFPERETFECLCLTTKGHGGPGETALSALEGSRVAVYPKTHWDVHMGHVQGLLCLKKNCVKRQHSKISPLFPLATPKSQPRGAVRQTPL